MTIMMIVVKYEKFYGHERYVPLCPTSQLICSLIRRNLKQQVFSEYLMPWQIELLKKAGWFIKDLSIQSLCEAHTSSEDPSAARRSKRADYRHQLDQEQAQGSDVKKQHRAQSSLKK